MRPDPDLDLDRFVDDLSTLIGIRTAVGGDPDEFGRARDWIRQYLADTDAEFLQFDVDGRTSTIIRPRGSVRPTMVADTHLEVVWAADQLFTARRDGDRLYGRGAADMKTALLVVLHVLRQVLHSDDHRDLWVVVTEDEEEGSQRGAAVVVEHLARHDCIPPVAFVPDGGHDFAYVEREKGSAILRVTATGDGGHASRPWLSTNPITAVLHFADALARSYPDPRGEDDWRPSAVPTLIEGGHTSNQLPTTCRATFDLRYTEQDTVDAVRRRVEDLADRHGVTAQFPKLDAAATYPADAPIARAYRDLIREITGRRPRIVHSAGASNGRFYAAHGTHVLMTNATAGGAHSRSEWVDVTSIPAYHELVLRTVDLVADRVRAGAPVRRPGT